jgi:hypothetical protein
MGTMTKRNSNARSRASAVLVLLASDVLLAFAMWGVAFVLEFVMGRGVLSEGTIVSIAPSVVAWVWMRAALGLYPGYGLDRAQGLRRETFALFATVAIIAVFALASQLDNSPPPIPLCVGLGASWW